MPIKPHAAQPAGPAVPDEYEGQGGEYEFDPKTGTRRLVHRTTQSPAAPAPATDEPKE